MASKRRGRGEGSIGKTADGRWWGRITLGYYETKRGKRVARRRVVYRATRGAVAKAMHKLLKDRDAGLPIQSERQTLRQYLDHWLAHVIRPKVREKTWIHYEGVVRLHLLPGLGSVPLSHLTPQRIQGFLNDHHAAGASAAACKNARDVLRLALNQAVAWDMLPRNPAAGKILTLPRQRRHEIRPLTPDQARALIAAVEGHRWSALFTVALGLGLRLGEAVGLRWADVDLQGARLSVRQTMQRAGGNPTTRRQRFTDYRAACRRLAETPPAAGTRDQARADLDRLLIERRALRATIVACSDATELEAAKAALARNARARGQALKALKTSPVDPRREALRTERASLHKALREVGTTIAPAEPKTERSRRTIALPALVVQALEAHRKRQLETRLAAGRHWQEHGLVFTSRIGTPTDGRNLHTEFKRILRTAGLPPVRFHDLRHTAATLLLTQGVSPRTIMETLGHSQISLTLNTYSHVMPALQEEAAHKMDAILTGTDA